MRTSGRLGRWKTGHHLERAGLALKPIITLTLNPTIDIAAHADKVHPIRKIRTSGNRLDPGGGGINVARVVQQLGGEAQAVFLAGGPTGFVLDELLDDAGIARHRIPVAAHTRISLAVHEVVSGLEYRFVPEGEDLLEEEWQSALSLLESCDADFVVASGSLPPGVPAEFYARLGEIVRRNGARFVLDTSGKALEATMAAGGIYLAKPSLGEFEALTGRTFDNAGELETEAVRFVRDGFVDYLAVTLGRDGALLASRAGSLRLKGPTVTPVSAVGAGDSFLAAMTFALSRGDAVEDAFMLGMAAGAGAVLTPGTQLCRREDVDRLYRELVNERAQVRT